MLKTVGYIRVCKALRLQIYNSRRVSNAPILWCFLWFVVRVCLLFCVCLVWSLDLHIWSLIGGGSVVLVGLVLMVCRDLTCGDIKYRVSGS